MPPDPLSNGMLVVLCTTLIFWSNHYTSSLSGWTTSKLFPTLLYLYIILIMFTFYKPNLQAKIIKLHRHLFNYVCLQALVNNNAYMAKQLCYHKLQLKNIWNLFVQACDLAVSKLTVMKHTWENIMSVTDRGIFIIILYSCVQAAVLCDVIRSCYSRLTPLLQVSHFFIRE